MMALIKEKRMSLKNLYLAPFFVFAVTLTSSYAQSFDDLSEYIQKLLQQNGLSCDEKNAICELDKELTTLLEKHGYDYEIPAGSGFFNLNPDRIPEEAHLEVLRKFKIALEKTRYVRDFSDIGSLYISDDKETPYMSTIAFDGKFSLYFPAYKPAEAYIGLLSNAPDQEPEYQKYLQRKREEINQKLEPTFGRWFVFHKMAEQILCHHFKGRENPDTERIREIAEEFLGEQVQDVVFERLNLNGERKFLWIQVDSPLLLGIGVHAIINKEGKEGFFYISMYNAEREDLIRSTYDFSCNFESAQMWQYREHESEQNLLWKRQWFDAKGEINRVVYANREEQSLEDIYQSNQYERPYSELEFISQRTDRVLVTILDTGVDYNHLDLAFKIWRTPEGRIVGRDYQDFDDLPYDYDDYLLNIFESLNHGTHVAGIATKGSDDIAILPIRYPKAEREKFYDAITFAHEQGSRIVNISLGNEREWHSLNRAISDHPDMLFVVAAGNDELNLDEEPVYPASFDHPNILVVASVNEDNQLSKRSNYSAIKVDVAAPGKDIPSLEPENSRGKRSGTSMAAPYVTRIAAKASFINPALGPQQIISLIGASVTKVPALTDKVKYGGVANEERALELARETLKL